MSDDLLTWVAASPITEVMTVPLSEGVERVIFSFGGVDPSAYFKVEVTY